MRLARNRRGASLSLLKHLGLGLAADPTVFDDPDAFMGALTKALGLPSAQLQQAAGAPYEELFGRAPPTVTRRALP